MATKSADYMSTGNTLGEIPSLSEDEVLSIAICRAATIRKIHQ